MSWTQGIQVREDCSENLVKGLDRLAEKRFGAGYKFMAFVWDDCDRDVLHLDFQNEEGDYRSLTYNPRLQTPTNNE